jgi:hypothetical protein
MYLPVGASASDMAFNTTKYPGICKPSNEATLQAVYSLQKELNRVSYAKGIKPPIAVDGDVGPGTVARFNKILGGNADCTDIAREILAHTASLAVLAAALQAPASVPSPIPAKAPTIVLPTGAEIKGPPPTGASALDSIKNLGMPMLLLLGAGAVGVGYYVTRKKGRK